MSALFLASPTRREVTVCIDLSDNPLVSSRDLAFFYTFLTAGLRMEV